MRKQIFAIVAAAGLILGVAAAAAAQTSSARTLKLSFEADGTVSLAAQNVTVREILAEWARLCGCYVVNADRLAGAPLTIPIEFTRAPQSRVLESLLRPAAGYVLTPRRSSSAAASLYETIYVLASSTATSVPGAYSAYTPAPAAVPLVTPGVPEDEIPPLPPLVPQPRMPSGPTPAPPAPQPPIRPGGGVPAQMVIVPIGPATPPTPNPNSPAPPTTPATPAPAAGR
jgi:hypothetical protein